MSVFLYTIGMFTGQSLMIAFIEHIDKLHLALLAQNEPLRTVWQLVANLLCGGERLDADLFENTATPLNDNSYIPGPRRHIWLDLAPLFYAFMVLMLARWDRKLLQRVTFRLKLPHSQLRRAVLLSCSDGQQCVCALSRIPNYTRSCFSLTFTETSFHLECVIIEHATTTMLLFFPPDGSS